MQFDSTFAVALVWHFAQRSVGFFSTIRLLPLCFVRRSISQRLLAFPSREILLLSVRLSVPPLFQPLPTKHNSRSFVFACPLTYSLCLLTSSVFGSLASSVLSVDVSVMSADVPPSCSLTSPVLSVNVSRFVSVDVFPFCPLTLSHLVR